MPYAFGPNTTKNAPFRDPTSWLSVPSKEYFIITCYFADPIVVILFYESAPGLIKILLNYTNIILPGGIVV